jgi:hypothetical protein
MADEQIEALYDDDDEPEVYPVRAVRTMPFYGQVLAWLLFRVPYVVYLVLIFGGTALCFFSWIGPGVGTTILGVLFLIGGFYSRTNYKSPWDFAVIQTRQPVPSDLRAAAAMGEAVPPENVNRERETET